MRPEQSENYVYEGGKPDDLTPLRIAELAVSAAILAARNRPELAVEEEIPRGPDPKVKAQAKRWFRKGLGVRNIAKKLGVSLSTISRWCSKPTRNNVPKPLPCPAESRSP